MRLHANNFVEMKHAISAFFSVLSCVTILPLTTHAQTTQALPEDLFNHLYWSVKGTHVNQSLGASGLDTIGYLSPSIRHAYALGEDGGSSLIYNRFPGDTARQYRFPGQKVIRGNLNGDAYPDYVCWEAAGKVTVLLGTPAVNRFDTAFVLTDPTHNAYRGVSMIVCRCDSDIYDDLVISDGSFEDTPGNQVGRIMFFRGGDKFASTPSDSIPGHGALAVGCPREPHVRYMIRYRVAGNDTNEILLYRLGVPNFRLQTTDKFLLTTDHVRYCCYTGGFAALDCNGDGIDDILFAGYDNNYNPNLQIDPCVFVYKGGDTIGPYPTYFFHRPFQTNSSTFGSKIVDLGHTASKNCGTLLISDPDASLGGPSNGAVFLYNLGTQLKDACVGYAEGPQGYYEAFGESAIPLGDLDGDGLSEFAVGANVDSLGQLGEIQGVGGLYVFHGSSRYVGFEEPVGIPSSHVVMHVFPNPVSVRERLRSRYPRMSQYRTSLDCRSAIFLVARSNGCPEHTQDFRGNSCHFKPPDFLRECMYLS